MTWNGLQLTATVAWHATQCYGRTLAIPCMYKRTYYPKRSFPFGVVGTIHPHTGRDPNIDQKRVTLAKNREKSFKRRKNIVLQNVACIKNDTKPRFWKIYQKDIFNLATMNSCIASIIESIAYTCLLCFSCSLLLNMHHWNRVVFLKSEYSPCVGT